MFSNYWRGAFTVSVFVTLFAAVMAKPLDRLLMQQSKLYVCVSAYMQDPKPVTIRCPHD